MPIDHLALETCAIAVGPFLKRCRLFRKELPHATSRTRKTSNQRIRRSSAVRLGWISVGAVSSMFTGKLDIAELYRAGRKFAGPRLAGGCSSLLHHTQEEQKGQRHRTKPPV